MAYDEELAGRVRAHLRRRRGISERRRFGGSAFLLDGHMACGVQDDRLMLRLGPAGAAAGLRQSHTRPMDFTGKPLSRMLYVERAGWHEDSQLRLKIDEALRFTRSLPPKER